MSTALGEFGAPPDAAAWAALIASAAVALLSKNGRLAGRLAGFPTRITVGSMAFAAAALSLGYVHFYLRGGPRIIDATSYFLEARAFASGHVAFPVPHPSAAFRGRFLLASVNADRLSVIFPPGYPALLSLGVLAGAPMLVGPALAFGLVLATFSLGDRLFADRKTALLAAALSTLSAVLRYHTADTMSHGASALLFALGLLCALDARPSFGWVSGALAGALVATRPVTGALGLALILFSKRDGARVARVVCGALPFIALYAVEQRIATGSWFVSTEFRYYETSDGPPGCFRYGFGAGVGCLGEHGEFVRAHLANGYGFVAAAGTTLRRLKMHLADAANTELFAPVIVFQIVRSFRRGEARVLALAVVGVVVLYAPFYFDGNYPGGGARFYADVLPLEHVLLARGLAALGIGKQSLAIALAGFALHTSYDHRALSEREGGRPMFEPGVLEAAKVRSGLVFVDTDHGFDLGYDPRARVDRDAVVARRRRDANDVVLWEALGRPPSFFYDYDPATPAAIPRVFPIEIDARGPLRFEAESEWPPVSVLGGSVGIEFPACASRARALALRPTAPTVRVRFPLEPGARRRYRLEAGWVGTTVGRLDAEIAVAGLHWRVQRPLAAGECAAEAGPTVELEKAQIIEIVSRFDAQLDYIELVVSP